MTILGESLFLPHGQRLSNRIAKSAMSERIADKNGAPSQELIRLYQRWATGGAGLLITGNVMIDGRSLGESGNVIAEDRRYLSAFEAWAKAAKAGGARVWMQINHPGRQSPRNLSLHPVSASSVRLAGEGRLMFARPRALRPEEIGEIVRRFATTAAIAEEAGFDGVQIHAAHGYLVSQFLSPHTNRRDDSWGGDPVRRRRFLLEVIRAVRERVSGTFAVGIKLNSADFQRGGFDDEESAEVVAALDEEGLDLIEISGGTYEAAAMFQEASQDRPPVRTSTRQREAYFQDYIEMVRGRVKTPLMLTGGLRSLRGMEDALASGVDVLGLARPLAYEPDLPRRLLAGEATAAIPISLSTGIRNLDSVIQGAWYQDQLARMGQGLEPSHRRSRFRSVLGYLKSREGTPWTPESADSASSTEPVLAHR
ncbi:MAG: NADH:flavin oxidoreductase/NADH oxidase family protein [Myxococcota bacterium]